MGGPHDGTPPGGEPAGRGRRRPAIGFGLDTLAHVAAAMRLVRDVPDSRLPCRPARSARHAAARRAGSRPRLHGPDAGDHGRRFPIGVLNTFVGGETLADAVPRLRETYCGTIAYEIEHIANHDERSWLRRVIESREHFLPLVGRRRSDCSCRPDPGRYARDVSARVLPRAQAIRDRGARHASCPMLRRGIELSYEQGTHDIVMGMAHRGRLNVLAHILGLSYEVLLAEFEGGRAVEETLTPARRHRRREVPPRRRRGRSPRGASASP